MDKEMFLHHVESNQRSLRRFLVALCCGDTMLAEDIAQETLMKAYLSLGKFNDNYNFASWLYKIACNTFYSYCRKQRFTQPESSAVQIPSEANTDDTFKYQSLYLALNLLSERERTAILLYYMHGYDVTEISEISGGSATSIRQLLSRGRKHLKELLISK